VDTSQLPLVTTEDGSRVLRMFWLDAYQGETREDSATVYVFGKVTLLCLRLCLRVLWCIADMAAMHRCW
jgi:hypothetical protein